MAFVSAASTAFVCGLLLLADPCARAQALTGQNRLTVVDSRAAVYPDAAGSLDGEATIVVEARLRGDGPVAGARRACCGHFQVRSGQGVSAETQEEAFQMFNDAAVAAARTWKFQWPVSEPISAVALLRSHSFFTAGLFQRLIAQQGDSLQDGAVRAA